MDEPVIPPDDPFLERRLTTLGALPVPDRPSIDDLAGRPITGEDSQLPATTAAGSADDGRRRSHRLWVLSGAAAAVLLVVISIAAVVRSQDADVASGPAASLAGREFRSVSVTEDGAPRVEPQGTTGSPVEVILRFDPDGESLGASAGCNILTASYAIEDNQLLVDDGVGTTQMACFGPIAGQDAWLGGILMTSPTLALDGDRLTLTSGTTVIELVDRNAADPDRPLVGSRWLLESVVEGESVASAGETAAYLRFTEEDSDTMGSDTLSFDGDDGCSGFGGTVEVVDDQFGMMERFSEVDGCPDEDVILRADAFAATFGPGATYEIEGSTLTITNGARQLVFRAEPEQPDVTEVPTLTPTSVPVDPTDPTPPTTAPARLDGSAAIEALPTRQWELESIVVGSVRTSAAPRFGTPRAYLLFVVEPDDPTWAVYANDGCNGGGGRASVTDTTVSFGAMVWTEMACQGGVSFAAVQAVLSGDTTYETNGETLIVRKGDRTLALRNAGPAGASTSTSETSTTEPSERLDQGWWTGYEVAADDRTVEFTLRCTYTSAERFDHADVTESAGTVAVKAVVATPAEVTADDTCTDDVQTFTVVLDEPLAGRIIVGPPSRPGPLPPDR